jgi:hypothetical protein
MHDYCRCLLREVRKSVAKAIKEGKCTKEQVKGLWVYNSHGCWEFHMPNYKPNGNDFYYVVGGKADCAYSARAEGLMRFLDKIGFEEDFED